MSELTKPKIEQACFSIREQAGEIVGFANQAPALMEGDDAVAADLLLAFNSLALVLQRLELVPSAPRGQTFKPQRVA